MNSRLLNIATIILITIFASTMSGCKDSKKKDYYNPKVEELDDTPDSAMFVRLNRISNDTIFVTPKGQTKEEKFGIAEAQMNGQIKGTLNVGDEYSIFPNRKQKNITIAINVSELKGRWFYDMTKHRGFEFGPYGALSAINNQLLSYREWKLLNGKLYIYFIEIQQVNDDRHEYFVEEAEILHLDDDNLQLLFRNETLTCHRQREVIKF